MKFSICNELYYDRSFEAACAHAHKTGYQGIEIAPFTLGKNILKISKQARRELSQTAKKYELEIVGLHWLLAKTEGLHLTSDDAGVRQRTLDYLKALVELCADLEGRVMVLGSPQQRNLDANTTHETGFLRACDLFQSLAPFLDEHKVTLALEPLAPEETNFLLTAESTIELIKAVGTSRMGLTLDVKAMSTESRPIPSIIESSQDFLSHFHANDPNRQGPGMGSMNFQPIADALKRVKYAGWVSVEVFDYGPGVEVLAEKSIATLKACWQNPEV